MYAACPMLHDMQLLPVTFTLHATGMACLLYVMCARPNYLHPNAIRIVKEPARMTMALPAAHKGGQRVGQTGGAESHIAGRYIRVADLLGRRRAPAAAPQHHLCQRPARRGPSAAASQRPPPHAAVAV